MADCNRCKGKSDCNAHKAAERVQLEKRTGNRSLYRFEDKIRRTGCFSFKKE